MGAITLSSDFGLVMGSALAIAVQCFFIGMIVGGGLRRKVFTKEYLEKHFGEEHKKATGQEIVKGGYPDTGNGLYAFKLSYKDWYDFNNRQRAHYNALEHVATMITIVVVAGISMPIAASVIGWIYFVGRIISTIGYVAKGPQGRLFGVILSQLCVLTGIVLAAISCCRVYQTA